MVSHIDIVIVIAYMFFCLVIGLINYGKIKNIRDYTLGTKPFSTSVLLVTTFATVVGAGYVVGRVGKVYELGLIFVIPLLFKPLSWIISAKIIAPNLQMFHRHKFISLSDIMEHWYGKLGRWVTNIISVLISITVTATGTIAIGYLLHYFLGVSETIGMIIALVVVTTYSIFGGIASIAFTDVFQFITFFVALPIACFISYKDVGSFDNLQLSLSDKHMQIKIDNIPLFIGLIFYEILPRISVPFIQRALIARNQKQFLQSFVGVAVLLIPFLMIVCFIGLITYSSNPNIEIGKVLYYFVDHYLPMGMKGLMVAGLLAVIMSTQDSYLNATSALISHDICKQIWPSLTDKQQLLIARISCAFIAVISLLLVFANKDIMGIIWSINNFIMPLTSIPLIVGLIGVRISKKSFIYVVLLSLATTIFTRFFTGAFDTRTLVVGMVTSAIVLYILHKKHKGESIFSLPKVDINLLFNKLNKRVLNNSYSISSLYTVGIVLCINCLVGIFF
ncbi:MAG: sodium:solute symporter family protein, partial [Rickettsiales bacterium]|nr:sodium:solute symporter family protein [Rickettsiales bacterium]